MRIVSQRALRGPNFFARFPVIYMVLDIQDLEDRPSDTIPGLPDRIKAAIPSLIEHRCSPGRRGGFFERLDRGTWAGHMVEHIALELQCLAGMEVGYGKSRELAQRGVYSVVYRYRDEASGLLAGRLAVAVLAALIDGRPVDVGAAVNRLRETREKSRFGPSTAGILREAQKRGIPHRRLNVHSHVMLGQGHSQRHIEASMTSQTTVFGVEAAADKSWTKQMLREAGVAVPDGGRAIDLAAAIEVATRIGWPVAVKPLDANHGRGITTGVQTETELATAFEAAQAHHDVVVVERHLTGEDHRLLVVGGRLVAAARRDPAHIVGDGDTTVRDLIHEVNRDPRRGTGHEQSLTRITVDRNTHRMLGLAGHTLDSVPEADERVVLKSTANLSTGGTATDLTDEVHPSIRAMAQRVARLVGLDIMGIDVVAPDLRQRLEDNGGGIVEVNAGPGLRMHLDPTHGTPRDVAVPIVDLLFADGDGRIPTVAVSGTAGKTTTARLIAHCLRYAGAHVGLATTDGVQLGNETILAGDHADAAGAHAVLRDPTTTHAVFEVGRAGLIETGMATDRVDVGILLNTLPDQMGVDEVHDDEDLMQLAETVPDVAGTAVLNADDPLTLRLHQEGRQPARTMLCTADARHVALKPHLQADPTNEAVVACDGAIEIWQGDARFHIAQIADVPATFGGRARCGVQDALACVAACHALGLTDQDIRAGITTFSNTTGQNPGRLNAFDIGQIRVLLDRGGTEHAVRALDDVIATMMPQPECRVLRIIEDPVVRPAPERHAIGRAVATHCDRLWLVGANTEALATGAASAGLEARCITQAPDAPSGLDDCLKEAAAGDLIVIQSPSPAPLLEAIRRRQRAQGAA